MKELLKILNEWLSSYLPDWMPFDKVLHFSVNFLLSLFGVYGAVFAAGLSVGKETGDYFNKDSGWCWKDLMWDGMGIIAGLAVNLAINFLVKQF